MDSGIGITHPVYGKWSVQSNLVRDKFGGDFSDYASAVEIVNHSHGTESDSCDSAIDIPINTNLLGPVRLGKVSRTELEKEVLSLSRHIKKQQKYIRQLAKKVTRGGNRDRSVSKAPAIEENRVYPEESKSFWFCCPIGFSTVSDVVCTPCGWFWNFFSRRALSAQSVSAGENFKARYDRFKNEPGADDGLDVV